MAKFKLYPNLKLSLHRKDDEDVEYYNSRYAEMRIKALQKSKYKCVYCGIEVVPDKTADNSSLLASGYLEVHHMDNNHQNNDLSNLYAVCPFCHNVIHLGFATMNRKVTLAYLPEISQENINVMSALIGVGLVANIKTKDILDASYNIKQAFYAASMVFNEKYNFSASDFVGVILKKQKEGKKQEIEKIFKNIKVIPQLSQYPNEMFLYWSRHLKIDLSYWEKCYEQLPEELRKVT